MGSKCIGLITVGIGVVGLALMIAALGVNKLNTYSRSGVKVFYGWKGAYGDIEDTYLRSTDDGLKTSNAGRCWLVFGIIGAFSFAVGCTLICLKKKMLALIAMLDAGIFCLIAAIIWFCIGSKTLIDINIEIKVGVSPILGIVSGILGLVSGFTNFLFQKKDD